MTPVFCDWALLCLCEHFLYSHPVWRVNVSNQNGTIPADTLSHFFACWHSPHVVAWGALCCCTSQRHSAPCLFLQQVMQRPKTRVSVTEWRQCSWTSRSHHTCVVIKYYCCHYSTTIFITRIFSTCPFLLPLFIGFGKYFFMCTFTLTCCWCWIFSSVYFMVTANACTLPLH